MTNSKTGELLVIATPIGNLEDITLRALRLLGEADLIAAEDTRRARQLLSHYRINNRLISLHEHNERQRTPELLARLQRGLRLALISDAGTPLISDPGFRLVRGAVDAGIPVTPAPGPSAAIAALSVAGLPSDRFVFEGFPPAKSEPRRRRLEALREERRTLVFYESSHRILDSLRDMAAVLGGERPAAVARELTKKFETLYRGRLGGLRQELEIDPDGCRGEFVVLVAGTEEASAPARNAESVLKMLLEEELPLRQASKLAARLTGGSRNVLYQLALEIGRSGK